MCGQLLLHRHKLVEMRARVKEPVAARGAESGRAEEAAAVDRRQGRQGAGAVAVAAVDGRRREDLLQLLDGLEHESRPNWTRRWQAGCAQDAAGAAVGRIREWGRSRRWPLCWWWARSSVSRAASS